MKTAHAAVAAALTSGIKRIYSSGTGFAAVNEGGEVRQCTSKN